MRVLFLFLDGVGLGADDPEINPFVRADMPRLRALLGGRPMTASAAPFESERVTLLSLDANLGVEGLPQSATGQAVLLTGVNIPAELGYHYGPKPNRAVANYLRDGRTVFAALRGHQKSAALLNAYPPRYFHGVQSGKRLYSSIPLAVTSAGFQLFTQEDYFAGRALAADFTGQGWHDFLKIKDAPIYPPQEGGRRTAALARTYDFSLFEYWATDYAGHGQEMDRAVSLLETFDAVLGGLVDEWDDRGGLIVLTSDHGNLEDLSTRRHTFNPVPCLLIGTPASRRDFGAGLRDLTGVAPAILRTIGAS
ncbi:MAG: peptidase [Chloroflexota bacterium]